MSFEYIVLDTGAIIKGNGLNLHLLSKKLVVWLKLSYFLITYLLNFIYQ